MLGRFPRHHDRQVLSLDGLWDFVFLGELDPASVDPASTTYDDVMPVPGCFDATPKYAGRRGTAVYRTWVPDKLLPLAADDRLRVEIDGAHHYSRVFLGGVLLGEHAGGFVRFCHDATAPCVSSMRACKRDAANAAPGMHLGRSKSGAHAFGKDALELVIVVDNAFSERSPLHREFFDWYHYGGLTRGVCVHRLGTVFIDELRIDTLDAAARRVEVRIRYTASRAEADVPLVVTLDGCGVLAERCRLEAGNGTVVRRVELPDAELWSPTSPNLHLLRVQLGADDWQERIGIRRVEVIGRQLCINGEPLQVRGVNRHEAHPHFGHAVPPTVQLGDLQLLASMGCNFVRGSHYPQDSAFLDLCDELGLCVYSEAIGWQHTKHELTSPSFIEAQSRHIEEMMRGSYNHPSVVVWGILNESESADLACRPTYERLLTQIRRDDALRPAAYASNRHHNDVCWDLSDIVCVNVYPGWYFGTLESMTSWLDDLLAHLRQQVSGKPILVSEIGAGGLAGFRDHNQQHWTEDYQALVVDRAADHLLDPGTDCIGLCVWQFSDCRIAQNAKAAMGRPRGYNNKGIVDEFRRPKLAFDRLRQRFLSLPEPSRKSR